MATTTKRANGRIIHKRQAMSPDQAVAKRKSIDSAALANGGKLQPAQNTRESGILPEDEKNQQVMKAAEPSLRDALQAGKLAEFAPGDLHALHREAHDAWSTLQGGADSWQPRRRGSRSGRREDFQGMKVAIEHDRGEVRTGKRADGTEWSRMMKHPYGYIVGSTGLDGEPVDVYLGPNPAAPSAHVVHQAKYLAPGEIGGYDEDKVMLGFDTEQAAREAYHAHMPDARFLGGVTTMPVDELRQQVMEGKALKKWVTVAKALHAAPVSSGATIAKLAQSFPAHTTFVELFSTDASALVSKSAADIEVVCALDGKAADALRARKAAGEARVKDARILSKADAAATFDGQQSLYFVDARSRDVNRAQLLKLIDTLQGKWMMVCSSANPLADALKSEGAHVKYAMTLGKDAADKSTWLAVVSNAPFSSDTVDLREAPTEKASAEPDDDGEPVEKTIFSSNSGKRAVADKLVSVFPEHKTYVEPFAGSAAVLIAKRPSQLEIVSDKDENIARAYRAIKALTPAHISRLEKMDWKSSGGTFKKIAMAKPRDEVGWLYKFLYLKKFSTFCDPARLFLPNAWKRWRPDSKGVVAKVIDKVKKHAARFKRVKVLSGDYETAVKSFDSPDTLHFADPPYVGTDSGVGEGKFDEERFFKVMGELQGRVAITLAASSALNDRFKEAGWNVQYFSQPRKISSWKGGAKELWQSLITNFDTPAAEWLKGDAPAEAKVAKAAKMTPDDVQAAHSNLTVEMVRRGMPHDSLLPPLFPDADEESGLGEEHADVAGEEGEALAKAVAKRTNLPEAAVKAWLAADAEAAQHGASEFPALKPGDAGEAAVATVEEGLEAPDAPPVGWEATKSASPVRCHTLLMLKQADGWSTIRVATLDAKQGSGLLVAQKGESAALADARPSPVMEPAEKSWQGTDGKWTRVKVQARGTFKAGRQADGWREFSLAGTLVDGAWVLQKVVARDESATLLRKPGMSIEKRAVRTIDADIVEVSKREDEKIVTGVVLQPEVTDAQGDIYSADVIKKTAYNFLARYGQPGGTKLGFMHSDFSKPFELVESWIAPEDTTLGGKKILKGTWMMSVRVLDDRVWRGIKERKFRGFSIGGVAKVQRLAA